MSFQRQIDRLTVAELAAEIDDAISVRLEGDVIVLRGHGVTERYGTVEEACAALRASWAPDDE